MSNGYCYNTKLSKKDCIGKLDNFLKVIKEDYNFLWEGNPSLIGKYGRNTVRDFGVDSNKQIYLNSVPYDSDQEHFSSLGIVRKFGLFAFYLEGIKHNSLITNSQTVYSNLNNQFDLSTKANFDSWAEAIRTQVNFILEDELKHRMNSLEENLKLK